MTNITSPQSSDYSLAKILQKITNQTFYITLFLSALASLHSAKVIVIPDGLNEVKDIIYLCAILLLFILTAIIDFYLLPEAHRKTRCDFFDNAFGTKFIATGNSQNYYSNDDLPLGFYKMGANLFESVLFTYNIAKRSLVRRSIFTAILITSLIIMSYYGFKYIPIYIVVLQTLLSVRVALGLLKLIIYMSRNGGLFNELVTLFSEVDVKTNINNYSSRIMRIYADYEANKGWANLNLNSKVYEKINTELSQEWREIRAKYNIN